MSQTNTTAQLANAQALVAKLTAEANASQFDSIESVGKTFEGSLVKIEYKGEPTKDSTGKQVERIPLALMATFVQLAIGEKYTVTAGQKFVNITRN